MQTGMMKIPQLKTGWICSLVAAGCFLLTLAWVSSSQAGTASGATWFVDISQYAGAAHGTLQCQECHGTMEGKESSPGKSHPDPAHFSKTQTRRKFDYQSCQKCHKTAFSRFLEGEHAIAAAKEKTTGKPSETGYAPGCGDCHSAHYAKSHLSRVQTGRIMIETCGACHGEQKQSYLANYHGKAGVHLGYEKAAFCTDCHGAHTMISLKDKEAALKACQRCHSHAGPEFANIIIHDSTQNLDLKSDAKKSGLKWVHAMRTLVFILVVAVLAFFYLHTGLLMLRKLHEKLRRHK